MSYFIDYTIMDSMSDARRARFALTDPVQGVARKAQKDAGLTDDYSGATMEYKRREFLDDWTGAHVVATIVDDVPDLDIFDGDNVVQLMQYGDFSQANDAKHERNLSVIRALLDVLTDFHAAYLVALHLDSRSGGVGDTQILEIDCSQ
jgi:hypothetical protein